LCSNVSRCLDRSAEMKRMDKVKVKFTLEQAMKSQRGSRGIALTLSLTSALDGGWSTPHPGRFTPRNDPVPIVHETG
jgi:hypothetical protein